MATGDGAEEVEEYTRERDNLMFHLNVLSFCCTKANLIIQN